MTDKIIEKQDELIAKLENLSCAYQISNWEAVDRIIPQIAKIKSELQSLQGEQEREECDHPSDRLSGVNGVYYCNKCRESFESMPPKDGVKEQGAKLIGNGYKKLEDERERKEFMDGLNEMIEKPFVTARFGDNWKEYAKDYMTMNEVVSIAWKQGRKAILLERALKELEQYHKEQTRENIESFARVFNHEYSGKEWSVKSFVTAYNNWIKE